MKAPPSSHPYHRRWERLAPGVSNRRPRAYHFHFHFHLFMLPMPVQLASRRNGVAPRPHWRLRRHTGGEPTTAGVAVQADARV